MIINILLIVHILAALAIIGLVLLQQGKGADMGAAFGGGGAGSQSLFGSRGSATFLSRATAIFALVFFLTSLTLAYMYTQRSGPRSVTDDLSPTQIEAPAQNDNSDSDAVPTVPDTEGSSSDSAGGDSAIPEVKVESGEEAATGETAKTE